MISSPNFARLVYDGDGSEEGNPAGPPGSGEVERVFADFWQSRGLSSEQIPFDGRSDYVGFTDLGIPAGGIFAGAEELKTLEQEAIYGGAAGEQLDPCYHDFCDRLSTILGTPPAEGARRPTVGGEDARRRGALDAPVPAGDDAHDLAFRQGQEPAARPDDVRAGDAQAPDDGWRSETRRSSTRVIRSRRAERGRGLESATRGGLRAAPRASSAR